MRYGSLFRKIALWSLALGGTGLIAVLWTLLPPHLSDIEPEGKAERARQLEMILAGEVKETGKTEEATDSAQAETPAVQPKPTSLSSPGQAKDAQPSPEPVQLDPMVKLGIKIYREFECFNCHKIAGKGEKKRKGPALDNIGNLVPGEMLKKKLLDPFVFSTEGFEKEYQKPVMPDNYHKLMTEKEMDALVAYMLTLKNPGAKTPKPIFDVKRPET